MPMRRAQPFLIDLPLGSRRLGKLQRTVLRILLTWPKEGVFKKDWSRLANDVRETYGAKLGPSFSANLSRAIRILGKRRLLHLAKEAYRSLLRKAFDQLDKRNLSQGERVYWWKVMNRIEKRENITEISLTEVGREVAMQLTGTEPQETQPSAPEEPKTCPHSGSANGGSASA